MESVERKTKGMEDKFNPYTTQLRADIQAYIV